MGSQRDDEAWRIATYMVERTRASIFEGDFEIFADSFTYPHTSTTEDKTIEIKDVEDMRRLFDNVRASHKKMGMTHLSRECIAAEFKDEDTLNRSLHQLGFSVTWSQTVHHSSTGLKDYEGICQRR